MKLFKKPSLSIVALLTLPVVIIFYLITESQNTNIQAVTSDQLIGAWAKDLTSQTQDKDCEKATDDEICFSNDSYVMDFSVDAGKFLYNSYLHNRPELSDCIWKLDEYVVNVKCELKDSNETFKIVSIDENTLSITRDDKGSIQYFSKIHTKR